ncbi:hypothetical protein M758_UG122500 [Ceratodon purpureus]|nr:hypothetical protein M758_UG122500 [Ceratodon purpureus]
MERVLRRGRIMEMVSARVKSTQDVLGLQSTGVTSSHPGKGVPSLQKSRTWKGPCSKGLGEIEEIGKEEVSNKMIQALERFMMAHPAVWSESSVRHLLVVESSPQLVGFLFHEVADTRYASEAHEHLQTIINRILVPMAKIMEAEQEVMMAERQTNHQATLVLQRAREECHHALEAMKQEHDRSAKDLEELQKALDENRAAAEEAGKKLAAKEKEIHDMVEKQRNLVTRLVCGGPTVFMEWAREELQSHGLADQFDEELWHTWQLAMAVPDQVEDRMLVPDECSSNSYAKTPQYEDSSLRSNQSIGKSSAKPTLPASWSVKLLCLVISEVGRQMEESYDRVKSPLSLPSVVAGFWIGLARRFTYLAVSSLLPKLVEPQSKSSFCDCHPT